MNTTIIITTSALLIVMLIPNHAFAFWGGGYCSENNSCNRPWNNDYNQQPQTTNVDYTNSAYINFAPNGFSCYGEWRCVSGWNHAIIDAPQDLANGAKVAQSSCPDGHTDQYCNGYTQGYVYAWNIQVNSQNPSLTQQQLQQQQCTAIGPGASCSNEQSANQGQSG